MAKKEKLSLGELLEQALVKGKDKPYKLPDNWVWTKFGYLARDMADGPFGSNLKREHYTEKREVRIIQLSNIGEDGWRDENKKYTTYEHAKTISRSIVKSGDIVIAKMMPAGRAIKVPDEENAYILSSDAVKFVPKSLLNTDYLLYAINSNDFRNQILSETQGITRARTSIGKMKTYAFPLPPLAEQLRIVAAIESLFEKLDRAKELARIALDSFENRKSAILHTAFNGELTRKWREENGIEFEKDWVEKALEDTDIEIVDGDRGANYPKKEEFSETGYCLFLNTKNVTKDGFAFDELNFISKYKDESLRKGKLKRNDVVLTTRGTIGNIAYYDDNVPFEHVRINSGMVIYRGDKAIYKPYLCWLYKSDHIKNQISFLSTGSAQPQLPIKIMKKLKLIIPPYSEQQEIVRILDGVLETEQKAKELCDVIEKIDHMKKAILARALRGQLGTNNPEEESSLELLKEILTPKKDEKITEVHDVPTSDNLMVEKVKKVPKDILKILKAAKGSFTPTEVYKATELDIDTFYEKLKLYINKGEIIEIRKESGEIFLEARNEN